MELNADFERRVVVHSDELDWVASPMAGVSRRMLDRIGDEVARATTVVRYDPGSEFSPHVHEGGEEFLVLDGVFQDEHGDFPAGAYIRNPSQSRHTPRSEPGCVLLVKLWQFHLDDRTHVRIDTEKMARLEDPRREGIRVTPLFSDGREDVRLEHWAPGTSSTFRPEGGAELFVLDGALDEGGEALRQHSWLRQPVGAAIAATAGPRGAKVWIKTGHLRFVAPPTPGRTA